jgi:transcriptional regulator with XRE-family HTH domain
MATKKAPPSFERIAFGAALAAARNAKGLSQAAVGEKFDKTDKAVSAWEKGHGLPDALQLKALAKLYESSPNRLLNFIGGSWSMSDDLRLAIEALSPEALTKVENVMRAHLGMPALAQSPKVDLGGEGQFQEAAAQGGAK